MTDKLFDAVVIGGGPAGLSCALTLARGGRTIVVCDDGLPRNKSANVMNNFPGLDGISPSDFLQRIRRDLDKYAEVELIKLSVIDVIKENSVYKVILCDGTSLAGKKLVLAEGVVDILPDIPGIKEGWGKSVFQCPYCHAYEHKNDSIGILADPATVFHTSKLLMGITSDIIIFTNGKKFLNFDDKKILDAHNIEIIEDPVEALVMEGERLKGIRLTDGSVIDRQALFIKPETRVRSDFGLRLGCKLGENGTYEIDENCKSCVRGVFIAGDVSSKMHSVLLACAEGSKAGLNLNLELLEDEFEQKTDAAFNLNQERGSENFSLF